MFEYNKIYFNCLDIILKLLKEEYNVKVYEYNIKVYEFINLNIVNMFIYI